MKRRLTTFPLFVAAFAIASQTHAQQFDATPPVNQPAYAAVGGHRVAAYAAQYAAAADAYAVDDGNGAYQQAYGNPATLTAQPDQVAGPAAPGAVLNYDGTPAPHVPQTLAGNDGGASGNCCAPACCQSYCDPFWAHRTGLFAEALFLKPRGGSDVASALPQNGIGPGAVPAGKIGSNSPTYSPGFRVGGTLRLDRVSSLYAAYTYYQAESNGSTFANPPLVVHSLVTLPQTGTAASDGLAAYSRYNIRFQFADADYRRLIAGGGNWYVNYAVGARYANLQQLFRQSQVNGPGMTGVTSNIGLDAAGGRVGLMGARKAANCGFFLYGNGFADILVGNFRSSFQQANNLAGVQGANTWQSFRSVPILEYELGAGWASPNSAWRFSLGYYYAAWFNAVTTSNYIQAVQNNNFVGVGNAITFDGFVVRGQRMW